MYQGFYLIGEKGNNAFSFADRQKIQGNPARLWVPSLVSGDISTVRLGKKIGFEEMDEQGELQSRKGLEAFVAGERVFSGRSVPFVVFDNHNHAFYFWHEAGQKGIFHKPAQLLHIDAHTDMKAPAEFVSSEAAKDISAVFRYTNEVLNVGNFIIPAIHTGCIQSDVWIVNSSASLEKYDKKIENFASAESLIVDIDLDFWNPELTSVSPEESFPLVQKWCARADFITIATSPFFIDQEKALQLLKGFFRNS